MKHEDNTWKEQMEGTWEAMPWIIIQQECARHLDTMRMRVIEQSNWRQGQGKHVECSPRVQESSGKLEVQGSMWRCTKVWEWSC